ncbi:FUSC family protein [Streptomyces sioyaensis]|uniref:FUSC family protein n=1 Tax=Streptomyces sioyaensis TaxID=67364 RepID=UPI0037D60327
MARTARVGPAHAAVLSRLHRATAISPAHLPLAAAVRGAVGLAVPLLVGMWTGWVALSVIAAVGALWGTGQDGCDPYRSRMHRLAWAGVSAALGLLIGELALRSGQPSAATVCLVVVGFVSGLVSLHGRVASVAGMHLLLGVVFGSGFPLPGPWWQAPLALLSGVVLVLGLSTAPWLWARYGIERAAVRTVYRAASEALAAAGTPAAEEARRRQTDALDAAHHVMRRHLVPGTRPPGETGLGRLIRAFHLAVLLGEAVTTLLWEARPLAPTVTSAPLLMAQHLLRDHKNTATRAETSVGEGRDILPEQPDTPGLRALTTVYAAAGDDRFDHVPLHPPPRRRPDRSAHLRYAVLLMLCVLITHLYAAALDSPRPYWLPMAVVFIYKPDFGPLFHRALHRCVGTVVGAAAIGAVALLTANTYAFIVAVAVFGALMAVGVRHHYAIATTGLTAVVFVLLDLMGDHRELYWLRILDTAVAAAVVLVMHFVVWPDSAADRAGEQTEAAVLAALRYRDLAPGATPAQRHFLRRAAYQQLGEGRRATGEARHEPPLPGCRLSDWEQTITTAERLCDLVTARALTATTCP